MITVSDTTYCFRHKINNSSTWMFIVSLPILVLGCSDIGDKAWKNMGNLGVWSAARVQLQIGRLLVQVLQRQTFHVSGRHGRCAHRDSRLLVLLFSFFLSFFSSSSEVQIVMESDLGKLWASKSITSTNIWTEFHFWKKKTLDQCWCTLFGPRQYVHMEMVPFPVKPYKPIQTV